MNIRFPVVELVDRYVIALIKQEKNLPNSIEIDFYQEQIDKIDISLVQKDLAELKSVHLAIWDLEKELKSDHERSLSLEEIGRRAIQIRDMNNHRILIKNRMADKLGCQIREIKKDHLSE